MAGDAHSPAFRETASKVDSAVSVVFIIVPILILLMAIFVGWAMWKRPDLLRRPYGRYGRYGQYGHYGPYGQLGQYGRFT